MRALVGGTFGALVAIAAVVVACGPNAGRFGLRALWRTSLRVAVPLDSHGIAECPWRYPAQYVFFH